MKHKGFWLVAAILLMVLLVSMRTADPYQHTPQEETPVVEVTTPVVETLPVEIFPARQVIEVEVEMLRSEIPVVEVSQEETYADGDPWGMTTEELRVIEGVVMAESGGESYEGQMAVAQCIRETAKITGKTPYEVATTKGQYTTPAPAHAVSDSVRSAVQAVLYEGESVVDEPIRYFYAPGMTYSEWHETALEFVCEIGGHRFFKDKG